MKAHSEPLATVSVIVPCRNEEGYIGRCLESIVNGDYPRDRLEVIVVEGRSDDRTRAILDDYASRYRMIRVLDNPRRITPVALNLAIRAARGEILVRMDAHVVYPGNYIRDLVAALQQTGADNVGGVLVTLPANETAIARAIATAMSHPFGVGNSYFRIGVREPRWVDTVAFFCCRRETFERVGLFDEELARHQDGEFNARLIKRGGRILLVPNVVSYYYARGSLQHVARMYHQYGYFKPLVARKLGRVMSLRQLAPPGLVLALSATAILSPWVHAAFLLFGATAVAYLLAVLGFSISAGRKAGPRGVAALALVFPVMHFRYGLGFLRRVLELPFGSGHQARRAELPLSR
ncbi:MAG TPA: glycosyltransferase family 2 protein [Gemmatimonadales bacterium]|nr:glycosyltransferase family 2 protein [Gemmatimonadales bacterium]